MKVIVFDLDDTLYREIDFVYSGFRAISTQIGVPSVYIDLKQAYSQHVDAFAFIIEKYALHLGKEDLLAIYRNHIPDIKLEQDTYASLKDLSRESVLGMITDGRTITQMNKIKALTLDTFIDESNIVISEQFGSEKPSLRNYTYFEEKYGKDNHFLYIGDNLQKDFLAPNQLGWTTVCLKDDGRNIHRQNIEVPQAYQPKIVIESLKELRLKISE